MKLNNFLKLVIAVVVSELAGVIGSVFTVSSIPTWYALLQKPSFSPPNWVFGPAWTTLYFLMGVAAFLVWRHGFERKEVKTALAIFGGQLALNTLWSIIFFGLHDPFWAFIEIIILWLAILATMFAFYKISRPAAYLLLPYILWVSFAGYLNYSIWQLNPSAGLGQVACTQEAKLCPDDSYVSRTGPNCEFTPCPGDTPEWLAIKQAIANCEVESVWQTHARKVWAKLKNGEELAAVEPKLDDIIDLAIAAESKCGEILMGTE
jgi:tryptophan-rich sensory protein